MLFSRCLKRGQDREQGQGLWIGVKGSQEYLKPSFRLLRSDEDTFDTLGISGIKEVRTGIGDCDLVSVEQSARLKADHQVYKAWLRTE
jgi:hypothetical protein